MVYLIQCYMEKVLPDGFLCYVEENRKSCRVKVGTKDKLYFATTIHHPTALLSKRFQDDLRQSLNAKLLTTKANHALVQRMKRFEFKKRTAKEKKLHRFANAYELQKRETESNRRRAEAKARNAPSKIPRKADGDE